MIFIVKRQRHMLSAYVGTIKQFLSRVAQGDLLGLATGLSVFGLCLTAAAPLIEIKILSPAKPIKYRRFKDYGRKYFIRCTVLIFIYVQEKIYKNLTRQDTQIEFKNFPFNQFLIENESLFVRIRRRVGVAQQETALVWPSLP